MRITISERGIRVGFRFLGIILSFVLCSFRRRNRR